MRTSFFALLVFGMFVFFNHIRKRNAALILVFSAAYILLFTYLYKPMWNKLPTYESLIYRSEMWEYAFGQLKEHWLTGIGFNTFSYTFPFSSSIVGQHTFHDPHNVYIRIATETGVTGLLSLCIIIYGFIRKWLSLRVTDGFEKSIKYSALCGFLITFVGGLLDTTFHHSHGLLFTVFTGLMFSLPLKHSSPTQSAS